MKLARDLVFPGNRPPTRKSAVSRIRSTVTPSQVNSVFESRFYIYVYHTDTEGWVPRTSLDPTHSTRAAARINPVVTRLSSPIGGSSEFSFPAPLTREPGPPDQCSPHWYTGGPIMSTPLKTCRPHGVNPNSR